MKVKLCIFFLVLLTLGCNVTEKSVVGYYCQVDSSGQQKLQINPNHTFVYASYHFKYLSVDSQRFETKGSWVLNKNKLILNSFSNCPDTNRISRIVQSDTHSELSNFSFQDAFGNMIAFDEIYEWTTSQEPFEEIFDAAYTGYDLDLGKHKILFFGLTMQGETSYAFVKFVVKDSKPANYKISIAPYYRQGYFINKTLLIRKKKLIDGHAQYLKARVILKITLPFYVHGPMYTY